MPRKKLTDEEKAAKKAEKDTKKVVTVKTKEEIEQAKKKLEERRKELEKKITAEDKIDVKKVERKETKSEKTEEKKDDKDFTVLENFVRCGSHLGTKIITPLMRPFVYRRRLDGLAVLNTNLMEQKLNFAINLFNQYKPEEIIIVCKREAGWKGLKLLSELTGIRVFSKKYPAGIITNIKLPNFFEPELIVVADPWLDKNALNDAAIIHKKVIAVCDTNNLVDRADAVIPANNKSNKSLGFIFYALAKEYMKAWKIDKKLPELEEFVGEKLESVVNLKAAKKREEELEKDKDKIDELLSKVEQKKEDTEDKTGAVYGV